MPSAIRTTRSALPATSPVAGTQPASRQVVRLASLFRSEITEARRLGYAVQTKVTPIAVVVRLLPRTQRTMRLGRESGAVAIESMMPCNEQEDVVACVHAALVATLEHARTADA